MSERPSVAHPSEEPSAEPEPGAEPDPSLLAQVCDIVRYAPIAILLDGPSMLPKLAQQGKVHMGNARYLGRRAVREAEPQMRRLLQGLGAQAVELLGAVGLVPQSEDPVAPGPAPARPDGGSRRTSRPAVTTEVAGERGNGAAASAGASAAAGSAGPTGPTGPAGTGPAADDLAIPDYESLSALHVVNRLPGLTPDELEAVRAYESAHRGRKTILNKVAQLQQQPT